MLAEMFMLRVEAAARVAAREAAVKQSAVCPNHIPGAEGVVARIVFAARRRRTKRGREGPLY
jgi:hypothetical protein